MELENNKKIYIGIAVLCVIVILIAGGFYFSKKDKSPSNVNEVASAVDNAEGKNNKNVIDKKIRVEKAKELVNVSVELIAAKNYDLAEKKLMDALRYDPEQAVAYCNLAVVDLNKNDIEASLENLETCFMKEPSYIDLVNKDPDYKVLWDDRRYKAIINRYK